MNNKTMKSKKKRFTSIKYLDPKCAGIDIGADSIFVCALNSSGRQEVREYSVFTQDLRNMAEWLNERGVESIAMESTGVYWIPVFEILEAEGFDVLLVNAYHLKNVPGRKTDVKDCMWIQQLHSNGLLQGSFRPTDEYVRLRGYVRQRSALFAEGARQIQHIHKALTQMNIQLRIAISDITGKTGQDIIQAIIGGERDPVKLASFRNKGCKNSKEVIAKSLDGNWREELILVLRQSYEAYIFFHKKIMECEENIQIVLDGLPPIEILSESDHEKQDISDSTNDSQNKKPSQKKRVKKKKSYDTSPYYFDVVPCLKKVCGVDITAIPGIEGNIATTILSEIGTDMSKWKSKKQFSSWVSLCPGNKKSGGKILNSRTNRSNNRVAQALRMAANAVRETDTAIGAYFRRMRSKFGAPKAITATAHKLAVILYTMLRHKREFIELGAGYYEERYKERMLKNLQTKARKMGFKMVPVEEQLDSE